jgi:hypothetical protein
MTVTIRKSFEFEVAGWGFYLRLGKRELAWTRIAGWTVD